MRVVVANSVSLLDDAGPRRMGEIPLGALVVARDPSRLPPDMVPPHATVVYASGAAPVAGTVLSSFESQHHLNRRLLSGCHRHYGR